MELLFGDFVLTWLKFLSLGFWSVFAIKLIVGLNFSLHGLSLNCKWELLFLRNVSVLNFRLNFVCNYHYNETEVWIEVLFVRGDFEVRLSVGIKLCCLGCSLFAIVGNKFPMKLFVNLRSVSMVGCLRFWLKLIWI